ncbi:glycosyltransferase family 4 protein [Sphingobium sp. H39-3-25]|uniref:glycosyltransferase family 4 protein n=1 Tax=Sphingobium arseniciresistens TaxID=3030834 RepID=UPI0023B9685B|nr:glycosyltransferase family 4 protein [Sphingobium arseniciresistens]
MPTILFAGLSAYGAHGGIQRFNRRVIETLERIAAGPHLAPGSDRPARLSVLMLADPADAMAQRGGTGTIGPARSMGAGGSRARFALAFLKAGWRADLLLLGHINLLPFAMLFRLLRPRGRVILFAHGVEVWGDPLYRQPKSWEPRFFRLAVDQIAIVSAYSRSLMARAFGVPMDKFSLFPNAVDVTETPARDMPGAQVLAVSRLAATEREKHVDALIRALPQVLEAVPAARLTIIGDGALREELEALAQALGVEGYVDFAGFVTEEELAQAYAGAALFALPSSKEGFGIVYLEAWLRGLPVIASRYGAGGEVVADGVDGFAVDPADIDAMARAMIDLLRDREKARRFAAAGRAKVEQLYSAQAFQRNLEALVLA